jgi:hypothetical protein
MVAIKIAEKTIPDMDDYWKKSTLTKADRKACHFTGWLNNGLESSIGEVNVVCFESHLTAGLGLSPSKFHVAIMNFLGCERVHFNLSAITDLSCFTMLCECWLGIAPDTSLFWYFYSWDRYDKVVYSGIGLSLHHHRRKEYNNASFKGSWKGATHRWFLVDMHVEPQWVNMYLLPPLIDKKRGELKMTPRLTALIKRVTELRKASD